MTVRSARSICEAACALLALCSFCAARACRRFVLLSTARCVPVCARARTLRAARRAHMCCHTLSVIITLRSFTESQPSPESKSQRRTPHSTPTAHSGASSVLPFRWADIDIDQFIGQKHCVLRPDCSFALILYGPAGSSRALHGSLVMDLLNESRRGATRGHARAPGDGALPNKQQQTPISTRRRHGPHTR